LGSGGVLIPVWIFLKTLTFKKLEDALVIHY